MKALDEASRRAVHALLGRIDSGRIELDEDLPGGETISFGARRRPAPRRRR